MEYKATNNSKYHGDDDGNPETSEVCTSLNLENKVGTVMGWWNWQCYGDRDENKGVMGTRSSEV